MIALRDFTAADVAPLTEILNDPQVTQFLSSKIPQPYTTEDALWWVNEGSKSGIVKAIAKGDRLIGSIGVVPGQFEYQRTGEIGFWLATAHWRQGITRDAIEHIVDLVFSTTDIVKIVANVFSANSASMQVLQRASFTQEAVLTMAIYKNECYYHNHVFRRLKYPLPSGDAMP